MDIAGDLAALVRLLLPIVSEQINRNVGRKKSRESLREKGSSFTFSKWN